MGDTGDTGENKIATLEGLKASTNKVLNTIKPSEFADDEFMQLLTNKLEDRNVDPRVIDYISKNQKSIHGNYDALDADQIEILNNKIEEIYHLFVEDLDNEKPLSQTQQKLIKRIFASKL